MGQSNLIDEGDAQPDLMSILDRVAAGEEFIITRHSRPIASLVPPIQKTSVEDRRRAIERTLQIAERNSLGGLKIKDLINEGRP